MPTREASHSFADQYLTIDYESVNTLLHDIPPPHQLTPPNNDALSLDNTNVFIEEESYYDANPTLAANLMHTVSPNRNTLISLELNLDPLSLDPSESDRRLFFCD